jgi:hypothetical protein
MKLTFRQVGFLAAKYPGFQVDQQTNQTLSQLVGQFAWHQANLSDNFAARKKGRKFSGYLHSRLLVVSISFLAGRKGAR